jgi:hypothetical protein
MVRAHDLYSLCGQLLARGKKTAFFSPMGVAFFCASVVAALILSPVLSSGLYSDDIANSTIAGDLVLNQATVWQSISARISTWIERGRFIPLVTVYFDLFWLLLGPNVFTAKIISLLSVCAAICMAAVLSWRLSGSSLIGLLVLVVTPLCIQLRGGNDPVLSYPGMMPIVLVALCVQGLLCDAYCRERKRGFPLLIGVIYGLSLLFYELAVLGLPLVIAIASGRGLAPRDWVRLLLPSTVALGLYFVALAVVRSDGVGYAGIEIASDVTGIARTFGNNLLGAVPFGYQLTDPEGVFGNGVRHGARWIFSAAMTFLYLVIAVVVASKLGALSAAEPGPRIASSIKAGLVLIFGAAGIMSLSGGYQGRALGTIHIQGLMLSFGSAIVLSSLIAATLTKLRRRGPRIAALAAFVVGASLAATISYRSSATVVTVQNNAHDHDTWVRMVGALESGVVNDLPERAILFAPPAPVWFNPSFVAMHTGKRFAVARSSDTAEYMIDVRGAAPVVAPPIYPATLADGIDFTRPETPGFVASFEGLSYYERGGRWSDANVAASVRITFVDPLPRNFVLQLSGEAFGSNAGQKLQLRLGDSEYLVPLAGVRFNISVPISLETDDVTVLELIPPAPTSPVSLGRAGDTRRLGVRLVRMNFQDEGLPRPIVDRDS